MAFQDGQHRTTLILEAIAEKYGLLQSPPIPLSVDSDHRRLQLAEMLGRRFGILPPLLSETPVATVTKTIGTSSRDYSTQTAWEADLDTGAIYSASDVAVGERYNDSAFNELVTINGGGTVGLASIRLTSASGERHDGTAGTGVRNVRTGTGTVVISNTVVTTVEWGECNQNGNNGFIVNVSSGGVDHTLRYSLLHGSTGTNGGLNVGSISGTYTSKFYDFIVYDITRVGGAGSLNGILSSTALGVNNRGKFFANITIHDVNSTATGTTYGANIPDSTGITAQNIVATSTVGGGTTADFGVASYSNATADHNASSDTSASGTGSLTSIAASSQYVSTVGGSEDLHLKSGADCIDAGTDLGTSPSGVELDIDGYDRDAAAVTWDIGADEYVSAVVAASYIIGGGIGGLIGG